MTIKARFHRGDAWGRGSYRIPGPAVLGSSDTGMWPDSPCKSTEVKAELGRFRKVLKTHGITSRISSSRSGNVFCMKRWVVVPAEKWNEAVELANEWLKSEDRTIRFAHDATS